MMKRVTGVVAVDREESGQGLTEYGLIIMLISIVAIAIMGTIGDQVIGLFARVASVLP